MLKKKLDRLCSGAINVLTTVPALVRAEKYFGPLRRSLDQAGVAAITSRFAGDRQFADGRKYLRSSLYLRDNLARTVALGLDRSPPLRVLDLGSGAGYFLLACRHHGHEGTGFDLPGNAFYREMFKAFRLERVEDSIRPFTPLPVDGPFDLITAFAITFSKKDRMPGATEWGRAEWHFFLDDLRRILAPGGRVFLRLNIGGVAGVRDARKYAFFHDVPPGFEVEILNRRELMFRLLP